MHLILFLILKIAMKKHLTIFVIFISFNLFSQTIDNIKVNDTVYIIFDEKESFDDLHLKVSKNKFNEIYSCIFPDNNTLILEVLLQKNSKEIFYKKKSFFEKIKLKTIKLENIQKDGYDKTLTTLFEKKVIIYIIDKAEIKRKIKIKRAFLKNIPNIKM